MAIRTVSTLAGWAAAVGLLGGAVSSGMHSHHLAKESRSTAAVPAELVIDDLSVAVHELEHATSNLPSPEALERLTVAYRSWEAAEARARARLAGTFLEEPLALQARRVADWLAAEPETRVARGGAPHVAPRFLVESLSAMEGAGRQMDETEASRRGEASRRAEGWGLAAWGFLLAGALLLVWMVYTRVLRPALPLVDAAQELVQGRPPRAVQSPEAVGAVAAMIHGWNQLVTLHRDVEARQTTEAQQLATTARKVQILDHTRLAILAFSPSGALISCNPGACMLLRYRREELLSHQLQDLMPPGQQALLLEVLRDLEILGAASPTTTEMVRRDGSVVPVEISGARLPASAGEEEAYFLLVEDITEKLKLRERVNQKMDELEEEVAQRTVELSRERDKVAAFLEQAPDMMFELDGRGRITYANTAAVRELGSGRIDDVVGQPALAFLSSEDRHRVLELVRRVPQAASTVQRVDLVGSNGRRVPVEAAVTLVLRDDGSVAGVRVVARSLAERTESERRQQLLLAAMEGTQDGVILTDLDGRIMHANAAATRMSGRAAGELVGMLQYELAGATPESQAVERRMLRELLAGGEWSGESTRWPSTDKPVPVSINAAVIRDAQRMPMAVVTVQRDLSEERARQAREQAFRDSLMRSEKLSALGELIAGVAHELNNPLGAVIGYAQLLAMGEITPQAQEDCTKLVGAAERCRRIVHNLLTFARKHKPERRLWDLNQVVKDAVALLEYEFSVTNISIELELDPELPLLSLDGHQIQQVLVNLLKNSEQAIHELRPAGRIRIRTQRKEGEVVLTFQDDGPGIPKEIQTKVFDPFFTTKEVGKGTGLGLSITFGIIKEHGGNIRMDQGELAGACFVVTLPVVTQEIIPEADTPIQPPLPAVEGQKILVVDDEEPIRAVVRRVLSRSHHQVDTAANADEALMKLATTQYDCILCDQHMPGGRGTDLLDRIWSLQPAMRQRSILITGDTVDPETQAYADRNGVRFCPKPFDLSSLETTVREVLSGHEATPATT
ncbi:MAG: PAS domain S-box protein [Myxococcota bacterium]